MSLFGCYICGSENHKDPECPERGEFHREVLAAFDFGHLHIEIVHEYDDWDTAHYQISTFTDGKRKGEVHRYHLGQEAYAEREIRNLNVTWLKMHAAATEPPPVQLTLET